MTPPCKVDITGKTIPLGVAITTSVPTALAASFALIYKTYFKYIIIEAI